MRKILVAESLGRIEKLKKRNFGIRSNYLASDSNIESDLPPKPSIKKRRYTASTSLSSHPLECDTVDRWDHSGYERLMKDDGPQRRFDNS